MARDIRQTINGLVRLALAPGSKAEGELARDSAIRMAKNHGLGDPFKTTAPKARPQTPSPPPRSRQQPTDIKREPPVYVFNPIFAGFDRILTRCGWVRSNNTYTNKSFKKQKIELKMFKNRPYCRHFTESTGTDNRTIFNAATPEILFRYLNSQQCAVERTNPW